MAKELSSIIAQAAQVRDAQLTAENTAERVGGVLCDLLEYLAAAVLAGDVQVVSDAAGTGIVIKLRQANGIAFQQRMNLPVANNAANGLLSPELLSKLNTAFFKSGNNETAIETRRLETEELKRRMQGTSDYSNAFSDPQVFLGDLDTMNEVNAAVNSLIDGTASPETKYAGHCVVGLQGCRFDVHTYALHFATGDFIQCVCGGVTSDATGENLFQHGQYNILYRRITNFVPGTWQGISTLIPPATEVREGLLPAEDKAKLNSVIHLGDFSQSVIAENRMCSNILTHRPQIFTFTVTNTTRTQSGLYISTLSRDDVWFQQLQQADHFYWRKVTLENGTYTPTLWTKIR